jgi:hypothetical protein
MERQVSKQD